ncbi:hypothetical protein ACVW1C_000123 [Bradyrhizobium sp. USDA 4011]
MQIGNPNALDTARHALRDAFDFAWMAAADRRTMQRAAHCAVLLSNPDYAHHRFANSIIHRGWRGTAPAVIRCETGADLAQSDSVSILLGFGDTIASALQDRR